MNPYHVLEVSSDADITEIRAAYRRLVRLHHPDCALDENARVAASERMVQINWAWHIVSDEPRRTAFDARFKLEQIEAARRQQESLRAQTRGQIARGQQSHMADILRAQAHRRAQQNSQTTQRKSSAPDANDAATAGTAPEERARARQHLEWQSLERERQAQAARARQKETRPARQRLTPEEKKRQRLARARVRRQRREDKKRGASPSARRQLAEAARLFAQEGRASDAIAICHDVLRVDFRNVPARELLGDFYLRLGRQDRALPLWEQALELQPDNSSVRRKLNALHPHAVNSYAPQPRVPRPTPHSERRSERADEAPGGFWNRLRHALLGGL